MVLFSFKFYFELARPQSNRASDLEFKFVLSSLIDRAKPDRKL